MATNNNAGVYQKDNGYWEYRFVMMVDGKKVNKKKSTDAFGNKLKTQKEAIKAREAAMLEARTGKVEKPKVCRRMVKDVYAEYCEKGRKDRAYQTIRKQDSLWDNHLFAKFGNRYVDEITVAEVMDYLAELYYIDKTDGDALLLAAKHGEDALCVGFQVDCGKCFCAFSWLVGTLHAFHTVNAVGSHVLRVIVKCQQIMMKLRNKIELEEAKKLAEDFVISNDLPIVSASAKAENIRNSPEELKKYVLTFMRMKFELTVLLPSSIP